jgi:hypothetical protein
MGGKVGAPEKIGAWHGMLVERGRSSTKSRSSMGGRSLRAWLSNDRTSPDVGVGEL